MFSIDSKKLHDFILWLNSNEGLLALILFAISAAFAWFSGIISALRRRPRLKIRATAGPTLCTVIPTGRIYDGHPSHRTCISIYLHVANAGSAPTSIGNISVGFKWPISAFRPQWWSKGLFRHWIRHQCVALTDFQTLLREEGDTKYYPFLTQRSSISGESANTYLDIGEITNGVIYFEDNESWGACQPKFRNGQASMALIIEDAFGGRHRGLVKVPMVSVEEARKYNPSFGHSMEGIRSVSPVDEESQVRSPS